MIEILDDYHLSQLPSDVVARFITPHLEDEEVDEDTEVETKVVRRGRPPKTAKATEDGVVTK